MEEDVEEFDNKTDPMVQQALQTLQDFVHLSTELSQTSGKLYIRFWARKREKERERERIVCDMYDNIVSFTEIDNILQLYQ